VIAPQVLKTFQDHCEKGLVDWSLYNIQAQVPDRFHLVRYHFYPGHYQLRFNCGREELTLNRWGPANVLLRERDLHTWFVGLHQECQDGHLGGPRGFEFKKTTALQWQRTPPSSLAKRVWYRATRREVCRWIRVWHLDGQNQILGVEACGPSCTDEAFLEQICMNYEAV
jgi:hypothetical protein